MPTQIVVTLSTSWTTDPEAVFPEADHYPDFVLTSLKTAHPNANIEVMEGSASNVTVNGQQDQDLTEQVRIHLWEAFCSTGFSDYTHLVALGG